MGLHAAILDDTRPLPNDLPKHIFVERIFNNGDGGCIIKIRAKAIPSVPEGAPLPILNLDQVMLLPDVECDCDFCSTHSSLGEYSDAFWKSRSITWHDNWTNLLNCYFHHSGNQDYNWARTELHDKFDMMLEALFRRDNYVVPEGITLKVTVERPEN